MSAPVRPSAEPGGLAGHLDGFVRAVRDAGIPVGISQAVDAAEILTVVDLLDREQLRHGLAAVLLQRAAQRPAYDVLFDLWWPLSDRPRSRGRRRRGRAGGRRASRASRRSTCPDRTPTWPQLMRDQLLQLLMDGDEEALRRFARQAVERLGRGQPVPVGPVVLQLPRAARALPGHPGLPAAGRAARRGRPRRAGRAGRPADGPGAARGAAGRDRGRGAPPDGGGEGPGQGREERRSVRWPTRSTSCGPRPPTWPSCAAPSPRWPAGWRRGSPPAADSAGRADWTSARPCGRRWAPAACPS